MSLTWQVRLRSLGWVLTVRKDPQDAPAECIHACESHRCPLFMGNLHAQTHMELASCQLGACIAGSIEGACCIHRLLTSPRPHIKFWQPPMHILCNLMPSSLRTFAQRITNEMSGSRRVIVPCPQAAATSELEVARWHYSSVDSAK